MKLLSLGEMVAQLALNNITTSRVSLMRYQRYGLISSPLSKSDIKSRGKCGLYSRNVLIEIIVAQKLLNGQYRGGRRQIEQGKRIDEREFLFSQQDPISTRRIALAKFINDRNILGELGEVAMVELAEVNLGYTKGVQKFWQFPRIRSYLNQIEEVFSDSSINQELRRFIWLDKYLGVVEELLEEREVVTPALTEKGMMQNLSDYKPHRQAVFTEILTISLLYRELYELCSTEYKSLLIRD